MIQLIENQDKFNQMELITKEDALKNMVAFYRVQYPANRQLLNGKYTGDIISQLEDEDPLTEERAIEIMGNDFWTKNECDECGADVAATVEFNNGSYVCIDCLNKAVKLLNNDL